MNISQRDFICFDIETTGRDTSRAEIVTLHAIKVCKGNKRKELSIKVKPSIPIEDGAEKVHGISNESVADCKSFVHYAQDVAKFFKNCNIGGYNIKKFDLIILKRQLEQENITGTFDDSIVFDAYEVFIKHNGRKLSDAVKWYTDQIMTDAHDAAYDTKMTLEVIEAQLKQENKTIEEVAADSVKMPSEHIITIDGKPTLNFGKHKGTLVEKLPQSYISWILKSDFSDEVKKVLAQYV